ncbi:MAG: ATP-grasp domain-containing protein [Nitrospinota bacterium]|nr:ATP-grasp domain-containing protein [Nitrospinota bacterium]
MKILLLEYLCAGGEADISSPLADEGVAMLRAAMRDFAKVARPFTIAEERFLPRLEGVGEVRTMCKAPVDAFADALEECDAALIIAPETGGSLSRYTSMAEFRGILNLGCRAEAMECAGNKLLFARRMEELGIPHPRTFHATCYFDSSALPIGRWVAKPVDGAGCCGARIHEKSSRMTMPQDGSVIAQEYVEGDPMSACVVAGDDGPMVVSVNRQFIRESEGGLEYLGGEVTNMAPDDSLEEIARALWDGIPGLAGFWGIDYIMAPAGPVVIEVNPRLTTSYCALGAATGANPALMILDAMEGRKVEPVKIRKNVSFDKKGNLRY